MIKGSKLTEEQKQRISEKLRGRKLSSETIIKLRKIWSSPEYKQKQRLNRLGHAGHKHTDEIKKKLSIIMQGNKNWLGKHHSEETKEKLRQIKLQQRLKPMLGQKHTEETKEKIRKALMGNKSRIGKPHTKETKEKIRISNLGWHHTEEARAKMKGKNNGNWKGGISVDKDYKSVLNKKYKAIRRMREEITGGYFTATEWKNLKKQYNYTCPSCGKKEPDIKLCADHIIPIICKGTNEINNIQPLCGICNSKKYTKTIKFNPILCRNHVGEIDVKF